jgi:hypothetical protein
MQPSVPGVLGAERQQGIVRLLVLMAAETAARWRAHRIVVQPFGDEGREGATLDLIEGQPAIGLTNA